MRNLVTLGLTLSLAMASITDIKEAYINKDYRKSYSKSLAFCEKNPQNIEANLFLGLSAMHLNKNHDAMTAFDRVLMMDPSNKQARVYMAILYERLGNKTLALAETDSLLKEDLPPSLRSALLSIKKRSKKKSPFYGLVSFGFEFDNNVRNSNDGKTYKILGLKTKGESKKSSIIENIYFLIGMDKKLSDSVLLNPSLSLFAKIYNSEKDLNTYFASLGLKTKVFYDNFALFFPINLTKTMVDSEDYLNDISIGIEARKNFSVNLFTTLGYEFDINKYENKDYDSNMHKLYVDAKSVLGSGKNPFVLGIFGNYIYEDGKEKLPYTQSSAFLFGLSGYKGLREYISIDGSLSYMTKKYKNSSPFFGSKRDDNRLSMRLGMSYDIEKYLSTSLAISQTNNNSNHELYEYSKTGISFNLNYRF